MIDLALQTPEIAWSESAAESHDLGWVGTRAEPSLSQRADAGGVVRFYGADRRATLPPPVVEAMDEAAARGEPTAWDGLTLLLARAEWLVASRGLLWTPSSAVPALLARLVEAAGVDSSLHRGDPARLRRLAALLPRARSGSLASAVEVLRAAGEDGQADAPLPRAHAASSAMDDEVFVARGGAYWARRATGAPILRVVGGLLRLEPGADAAVELRCEDLPLRVDPRAPPPRDLVRLLPVWTVPRPVVLPPEKE